MDEISWWDSGEFRALGTASPSPQTSLSLFTMLEILLRGDRCFHLATAELALNAPVRGLTQRNSC